MMKINDHYVKILFSRFHTLSFATFEFAVIATFEFAINTVLFQVTAVIAAEVDERIVAYFKSLQVIDDLTDRVIELHHTVAIFTVLRFAREIRTGKVSGVHLEKGGHQEKPFLVLLRDELETFVYDPTGKRLHLNWLLDDLLVPHQNRVESGDASLKQQQAHGDGYADHRHNEGGPFHNLRPTFA